MRILAFTFLLALAFPLSAGAHRHDASRGAGSAEPQGVERKVAAEADVTISLCVSSGDVIVRGWDRGEVRARSEHAARIVLRAAKSGKGVEVLVSDHETEARVDPVPCETSSDVELDVPRGATVQIKVHEGDVDISNVAEARVESLNGDVDVRRVSRAAEVSCLSGDISLSDSKGRVRLQSVSGSVEASNVAPEAAGDDLQANSTSGDISLARIGHASVKGATISGSVRLSGPLTSRGSYEFTSHSGDVTMALPADASFKVNARIIMSGEIITDFPVTASLKPAGANGTEETSHHEKPHKGKINVKAPKEMNRTNLVGVVGRGDAELKLTSFSGTVYLKKE